MAAHHALGTQFEQLPMFMTGTDLKGTITSSADQGIPGNTGETLDQMWDRKASESAYPAGAHYPPGGDAHHHPLYGGGRVESAGLMDSIRQHGYNGEPVTLYADHGVRQVMDAHHRIASAAHIEAETGKQVWIPMNHRGKGRRE